MVRAVQLPGITVGIGEAVTALERVAGKSVAARVRWERDPMIEKIVAGWAARVSGARGLGMGFKADTSIDEIIRAHIDDELGGDFVH